ncbi:glycosyltransferase [Agrococcus sp. SL85]|uniref:glycosyltransferase n=1 Tax=Agrococcus sp. SL85 TaxID=2995141 RepID=UPI00226C7DBB|nr:glycosyltransferase [Agrococcus sp. SL85]WAC65271.1 glycosyltransferase [Agrococcus sp. SL85]
MSNASTHERSDRPLISIIVPVYNVEAVLPELLDSMLAQTWDHWEAVLVIDGSPDASEAVARSYERRDARFRVIATENGGIGRARNVGLDHANGSLLAFSDSDDVLTPDALESLVTALEGTGAEIATGIGTDFFPNGRRVRYWTMAGEQFSRGWGSYRLADMPSLLEDHVVWAKLFRRDLLDRIGLRFPEGIHCEDIAPMLRMQLAAETIAVVPREVYLHRRHEATVSADYLRPSTLGDWVDQAIETIDAVEAHGDRAATVHYVGSHTLGQWWTRAELVHLVDDPALLAGIERLAARMVEVLGDDVDLLDPVRGIALLAFARGVATRRWSGLGRALAGLGDEERRAWEGVESVVASPLAAPTPKAAAVTAVAALRAAALLDASEPIEARLAAEILVSRVVAPIAHELVEDAGALIAEAEEAVAALPREAFADVASPAAPDRLRGTEVAALAWTLLERLPLRTAAVTGARLEHRGLVLRGRVDLGAPLTSADGLSVVLRSADGSVRRKVPVWATPSAEDPALAAFSAPLPTDARVAGRALRAWLRRDRRQRGPIELPLAATEPPVRLDIDDPIDRVRVEVGFAAPAPLRWTVERRHEAVTAAPRPEREHRRVYSFPDWGENPYVAMLQLAARGAGIGIPGSERPDALIGDLEKPSADGIVHIQWTSPITERAHDQADADATVDGVLAGLDAARAHGRPILWTVHNVLPHDSRFRDAAIRLHQGIADRADLIHTLGTTTQEAIGDLYVLPPEKVRVLPHSSYAGIYGARLEQAAAREEIGAGQGTTQALFFGQIRPYKGLEHLFEAARRLHGTETPIEVLLAGKPAPKIRDEVQRFVDSEVDVTAALRYMEDDEIAAWFSAADVAVLPYRNILNSGTMHLAATFGLPVMLPDEHTITADYGDEAWIRFFDTEDPAASIAELLASGWYRDPAVRESALAYARERSPYAMGEDYLALLDEVEAVAAARRSTEPARPRRRRFLRRR